MNGKLTEKSTGKPIAAKLNSLTNPVKNIHKFKFKRWSFSAGAASR